MQRPVNTFPYIYMSFRFSCQTQQEDENSHIYSIYSTNTQQDAFLKGCIPSLLLHDNNRESIAITIRVETGC
jgi:hypothetical protein